jgi:DNA-binding LacI/PurR family transcriptional regulator
MPEEGKHRAILALLKSRIMRGIYEGRMPGERDLATELGVSAPTVKIALIQLEAVGLVRRRLRSGTFVIPKEERPQTFAPMSVFMSHGAWGPGPGTSDTAYGFGQAAQQHGLSVMLSLHQPSEIDKVVGEVLASLRSPSCMGACLLALRVDAAHALRLAAAPGPVVLGDWEMPDPILPTVNHDNREAGRLSAAHLIRLGHRRILYADPIVPSAIRSMRIEGAAEIARAAGAAFQCVRNPELGWGARACAPLLARPDRPTAAICSTRQTSLEMKTAAESLGLSVPRDLSLVHMDGSQFSMEEEEFITCIVFDGPGLGAMALRLLLELEPGMNPRALLVPVRLADRGSTAPPPEPK